MPVPTTRPHLLMVLAATVIGVIAATCPLAADERRAPPPTFPADSLRGVFFDDLDEAFRGTRPTLSSIRSSAKQAAAAAAAPSPTAGGSAGGADAWSALISPVSLEDEVKRLRLHYDSVVTTPGAFNGGGYQDARLDLTVLATLFAVIQEHSGDVRWKDQAAAARDLLARTAFNCKAGSTQVYNEAKLRKADLQDLVSGSGLSNRDASPQNQWNTIADRSPLMAYAESLVETLESGSSNEAAVKDNVDKIKRNAELLAMLGEVLTREGMDDADDGDYVQLSKGMTAEARGVVAAVERGDYANVGASISAIRQRCDACHEQYR